MRSKSPASSISSPASSNLGSTVSGRGPGGGADLALLVQDARGLLVALELQQPPHQLLPRVHLLFSPSASVGSTGTSILDLMWMRVAAMTMNSPATSRFSSCIRSRYSMYWRVMGAMGMSWMSIFVAADEVEQEVERPLEDGELDAGRVLGQRGLARAGAAGVRLRGRRSPGAPSRPGSVVSSLTAVST